VAIVAGEHLGAYRLIEKIGEGGMGVVWRAHDTRLDRPIAIKFLPDSVAADPARLSRFRAEAKVLASLSHPNIVTIHSIEESGGAPFFTMELVDGKPLDSLIPPGGLGLSEFLHVAIPLCEALAAAHSKQVAHRDLKPSNVLVAGSGLVKVVDFGLARATPATPAPGDPEKTTVTARHVGVVSGTLAYLAPEQIRGEEGGAASDIFSLGVLLYEMASGRRPFRGGTAADVMAAILREPPRPLTELRADVPRRLDRVVLRCLERDPALRPAGVLEVRDELAALQRDASSMPAEGARSVAVLPFADMSQERDQDYFCEGIAEEILNALIRVEGLRVASRMSSFRFRDVSMDSREIGDRLGVNTLVEGSVRKVGSRLRISAQLVDVAGGFELWSERYDRELQDIFAIQDEIAQSVASALKGTLSPRERRAIKQVATADVRAYEFYLRGRKFFNQYGKRSVEFALQMFTRAIEVDASYALAWAGVADCCSFLYMNAEHREEHRRRAEEASRTALEFDPDSAEAHTARGVALSLWARHDEAETAFEAALALNPRLFEAYYFYARDCFIRGELERAIELYEKASEVRPDDWQSPLLVAQLYDDLRRPEAAAVARRKGVSLSEARLEIAPDDVRALYMGANGLVALGEAPRGLTWARRALEIAPDDTMLLYNVACIFSLAGETGEALGCLERAVQRGFAHKPWLERDSNLDPLRDDPRYRALLDRLH
jgi:non-specific serine/threonine protein kinase